jgi:hypothetical protein
MVQLMQQGSLDFINGDPIELTTYFDLAVDIHHIFPQAHCEAKKYPRSRWNSIVNKAPLTSRTNRAIGGRAPSVYLGSIQKSHQIDSARLDRILETHLIDLALLRQDNFEAFLRARASALLGLVEKATGKQVSGRDSDEAQAAFGGPLTNDVVTTPQSDLPEIEPDDAGPSKQASTPEHFPGGDSEEEHEAGEVEKEQPERYAVRQRFWAELLNRAKDKTKLHANISAGQNSWLGAGSGRRGLGFNYIIRKHGVAVQLYIDRGKEAAQETKAIFDSLAQSKDSIDKDFGEPLEWRRLEGKRACLITKIISAGGYRDESKWKEVQDAMIDAMVRLERALKPHIAKLQL